MTSRDAIVAEPFVPVSFDAGDGVTFQACWDSDRRELVVLIHGRHAGRLAVLPRSDGSFAVVRYPAPRTGVGEKEESGG